jgi:spore germination cell wall hydrolase CwlJ-like protein
MTFAQEVEVSVAINNQFIQDNASHYIIDGQIYVVARVMAEAAGGVVTWIPETQELQIQYLEKTFRLQVGKTTVLTKTAETTKMDESLTIETAGVAADTVLPTDEMTEVFSADPNVIETNVVKAPFVRNGKTYVPIQFITENFDMTAKWFEHSFTLHLIKEGYEVPLALRYQRPYTDVDLIWLARIIQVETPSGSQYKKMAVANVVLNRVKSPRFPNTIKEVIFSPNQFPPATRESFLTLEPSKESFIAAKRALEGNNPIEGCLFFNNRPFAGKKDDFYKKIEGDYFYK